MTHSLILIILYIDFYLLLLLLILFHGRRRRFILRDTIIFSRPFPGSRASPVAMTFSAIHSVTAGRHTGSTRFQFKLQSNINGKWMLNIVKEIPYFNSSTKDRQISIPTIILLLFLLVRNTKSLLLFDLNLVCLCPFAWMLMLLSPFWGGTILLPLSLSFSSSLAGECELDHLFVGVGWQNFSN